jgi:hypothetical protein
MRNAIGFPKDKIYVLPGGGWETTWSSYLGAPTDGPGLARAANKVQTWMGYTRSNGYANTYFYAIDESTNPAAERAVIGVVHANGGKELATSYIYPVRILKHRRCCWYNKPVHICSITMPKQLQWSYALGHKIALQSSPVGHRESAYIETMDSNCGDHHMTARWQTVSGRL